MFGGAGLAPREVHHCGCEHRRKPPWEDAVANRVVQERAWLPSVVLAGALNTSNPALMTVGGM